MAKWKTRWFVLWLVGLVLPGVLSQMDDIARGHGVHIGCGYEMTLFLGPAIVLCIVAISKSEYARWLKALLMAGTLVGLSAEMVVVRAAVQLVLHGLGGTQ